MQAVKDPSRIGFSAPDSPITCVTSARQYVVAGSASGRVFVWNSDTRVHELDADLHPDPVADIASFTWNVSNKSDVSVVSASPSRIIVSLVAKGAPVAQLAVVSTHTAFDTNWLCYNLSPYTNQPYIVTKQAVKPIISATGPQPTWRLPPSVYKKNPSSFDVTKLRAYIACATGHIAALPVRKGEKITITPPVPQEKDEEIVATRVSVRHGILLTASHYGTLNTYSTDPSKQLQRLHSFTLPVRYAAHVHFFANCIVCLSTDMVLHTFDVKLQQKMQLSVKHHAITYIKPPGPRSQLLTLSATTLDAFLFVWDPLGRDGDIEKQCTFFFGDGAANEDDADPDTGETPVKKPCILCRVCMERSATISFDCGHLCCCTICKQTLVAYKPSPHTPPLICPMCNQPSANVRRVFYEIE
jgi:WD40 repeat protein